MANNKNLNVASEKSSESEERVYLDVGGVHYTTTRETLTSIEGSWLAEMLAERESEREPPKPKKVCLDTAYREFIDRDGELFRHVLNFLRYGKLSLPGDFSEHNQLMDEAKFYRLETMEEELAVYGKGIVHLNVGGVEYTMTEKQLKGLHGSSLKKLIFQEENLARLETRSLDNFYFQPQEIPILKDVKGRYCIDKDGDNFGHILNYLKTKKTHNMPDGLAEDASYYGLRELYDILHKKQETASKELRAQKMVAQQGRI